MQDGTVRPADAQPTRSRLAPWWLVAVSASFAALWGLLLYCDLFRITRVLAKIQQPLYPEAAAVLVRRSPADALERLAAGRPQWRTFVEDTLAFDPAWRPTSALVLADGLGGAPSTVGG